MSIPFKYIEENLVFNKSGNVYAYYEWLPYNYSFIGEDKALSVFHSIQQLISQSQVDRFQMLLISSEESIHDTLERSKKQVKGELKDLAFTHIEGIEEQLKTYYGDNEVNYRYFIGFKLSDNEYSISKETIMEDLKAGFHDLGTSINKHLLGDYTTVSNKEIEHYLKLERLLEHKITRHFKMRKINANDYGYIIEHLNGQRGVAYNDYKFTPDINLKSDVTEIKTYDLMNLEQGYITENKRYLEIDTEEEKQFVSYLSVSKMTGEMNFPFGSEIFFYQQEDFDFPVDISIDVECLENNKALSTLRTKKMELKDLDESAFESNNDSSNNLLQARDDASELESILENTKENMFKISYVIRIVAPNKEERAKRISQVKDFYKSYNMIVQCPLGDQLGLHEEFYPSNERYMNDYVHYVTSDFLASLGFGATQQLGEKEGMYIGYNVDTGKAVYINPWLAAQGIKGTTTNALAKAYLGSLGGGKSVTMNLIAYYSVLYGGKGLQIDPKGERNNWKDDLSFLGNHLNVIEITNNEKNKGLLDPFSIMNEVKDAESLALDTLTFITGIHSRDSERFPVLREHVKKVALYREKRGMLQIIKELRKTNTETSNTIASHIESFTDLSIAGLLFGDGKNEKSLNMDGLLNVVLVQDLVLPDSETPVDKYTTAEILSVAILLAISTFSLDFIKQDRSIFKFVDLDEAWSWLQISEGKTLSNKLVRAGRSMNTAIDFGTQNCDDLLDEKMKNNIGMKFAFRSTDKVEIGKTLTFFGLECTEENMNRLRNLENGDCLFQDICGNVGVVHIDYIFEDLFRAFDTRPPMQQLEV